MSGEIKTIGGSFSLDRNGLFQSNERYVFMDKKSAEDFASAYEEASFSADETGVFWVGDYKATDAHGLATEELDFSMKEEPIQSHPNFATDGGISTLYGYNETLKEFSINVPDDSILSDVQTTDNNGKGGDNPLYGCTSFLSMTATFRRNETVSDLADIEGLFDDIGKISMPESELITIPEVPTRNWLKLAPKVTSRANVFEVSRQWMMSGAGGWNSKIYGAAVAASDNPLG